jgi:cell division cycle 20-like protein 1 (cofactor of APC complex)
VFVSHLLLVLLSAPQVCNLAWSKNVNEIVSAHGYSQNQLIVWKYPSMTKLSTLTGHSYRVLYLAVAPDGQSICTGAGDETLRFWSIFPGPKAAGGGAGGAGSSGSSLMRTTIR